MFLLIKIIFISILLTLYIATTITTKLKINEYIATFATPVFKLQQQQQPCFKAGIFLNVFTIKYYVFTLILNYSYRVVKFFSELC